MNNLETGGHLINNHKRLQSIYWLVTKASIYEYSLMKILGFVECKIDNHDELKLGHACRYNRNGNIIPYTKLHNMLLIAKNATGKKECDQK